MLRIPISCSEFYEKYFEKQHCYAPSVIDGRIFTWDELDELLFSLDPKKQDDMKIMLEGRVSMEEYSSKYQDLNEIRYKMMSDKLGEILESGATMVINRLDLKSKKIAMICQSLSDLYSLKTVANGYFALGGVGAFGKHWDTHDVFAIQLLGKKRWRVFGSTFPLPLEHQTSSCVKDTCPEITVFDGILNAGDLLYVPRGWWHEVTPMANEPSFHLAIGGHTAKLLDYLMWVANDLLPMQELARTSAIGQERSLHQFASLVAEALSDFNIYSRFCDEIELMKNDCEIFDIKSIVR